MSSQEHVLLESGTTEELPGAGAHLGDLRVTRVLAACPPWLIYQADAPGGGSVRVLAVDPQACDPETRRQVETVFVLRPMVAHNALPTAISTDTDGTLKWFTTEEIHGEDLQGWLGRSAPPRRRRVELVIAVAEAVHQANLRGLVHGGVGVDRVCIRHGGHPVLLDAGWLGATRGHDARTDVYGIGVLLHQVVAGHAPDAGSSLPRGDLRRIAGRCLAPDPDDRYDSASEVAEDLRRHLHHLPIRARRAGFVYSSFKALRRYFMPIMAVGTATMMLMMIVAVALLDTVRAEAVSRAEVQGRERAALALRDLESVRVRAREAAVRDQAVARFLASSLAPPDQGLGVDPALSDIVYSARWRIDAGELASTPEAEAAARTALADAYRTLGQPDQARVQHERVLELARQGWLPEADASVAYALRALADPRKVGNEEGRAMLERALDIVRTAYGDDHPEVAQTWLAIGRFHRIGGAFEASERAVREAIDRLDSQPGTPAAPRADARQQLATVLRTVGRYDEAEQVQREALAIDLQAFSEDHLRVATDRLLLGSLLVDASRPGEGRELIDQALAARNAQLGETHPRSVGARLNRVDAYVAMRWSGQAQVELDKAMSLERARTGDAPDDPGWWVRRAEVALLRNSAGDAHIYADRALLEREQEVGLDHWRTAVARGLVGRALLGRGRKRDAEPFLREARDILMATVGPSSHHLMPIQESLTNLGIE